MPELPEVETARRGIAPHIEGKTILKFIARVPRLRHPISADLDQTLAGQKITRVKRRGKYLLLLCTNGIIILHLGMTGHLRVLPASEPASKHDRIEIVLTDGNCLRMHDPRRFGTFLWTQAPASEHPLLASLGPEPLEIGFDGDYLHIIARSRSVTIKQLIMDNRVVVGVGNMYANEALFRAGISPLRLSHDLSHDESLRLATSVQTVLQEAISAGEATLDSFLLAEAQPVYFQTRLHVYGRGGLPCCACGAVIVRSRTGGRSTFHCPRCQS